eukprot:6464335-Amphidinium_carterae.1
MPPSSLHRYHMSFPVPVKCPVLLRLGGAQGCPIGTCLVSQCLWTTPYEPPPPDKCFHTV